ncbi:MAG: Mur ligase family protein, partial [Candidatus Binatia bacterium]
MAMRLKEFLTLGEVEEAAGELDQEVTGLTYDSRQVSAGQVFFAVAGEKSDGHNFIADTVKRGAAAFVYSKRGNWPRAAAAVRVRDVRRAMGLWAAHYYQRPSQNLKLVGVTGTNGKTTLTYLIESMLKAAALAPGVIGTINYRYHGHEVPSHHTTPESLDLQAMLAAMTRSGVKSVAMEVSSHALAQERVRGLEFDVGVFTNLSRDHLDYHRDMDDYFLAKSRLFTDYLSVSPKAHKAAVIYGEDPRGGGLSALARAHGLEVWTYGEGQAWDVHPLNVLKDVSGLRGKIDAKGRTVEFDSPLIGGANLQNILGAVAVGFALGLDTDVVAAGIR